MSGSSSASLSSASSSSQNPVVSPVWNTEFVVRWPLSSHPQLQATNKTVTLTNKIIFYRLMFCFYVLICLKGTITHKKDVQVWEFTLKPQSRGDFGPSPLPLKLVVEFVGGHVVQTLVLLPQCYKLVLLLHGPAGPNSDGTLHRWVWPAGFQVQGEGRALQLVTVQLCVFWRLVEL